MRFYRSIFILLLLTTFVGGLFLSFQVFYDDTSPINDTAGEVLPSFTAKDPILGGSISDQDIQLPAIVNLWASWCTACLYEHPVFIDLNQQGIRIYGINHQDKTTEALKWLDEHGNPFTRIIEDPFGSLGESLDVYGLPETLLIDKNRQIVVHHRGVLTSQVWRDKFLPLWEKYKINGS